MVEKQDRAELSRCGWCGQDPLYQSYHDEVWGRPVADAQSLFAKLCLDGQQAGLSWITILRKRDTLRSAFDGFEPALIAEYGEADIERLLNDPGIIRSRAKINAAIGNAQAYLAMQARGEDFSEYLWRYVGGKPITNRFETMADVPTQTEISAALSKDLKKRGFKFCGPVIVYAFMQAVGMVNDHLLNCHRHAAVAKLA